MTPHQKAIYRSVLDQNPILKEVYREALEAVPEAMVEPQANDPKDVYALRSAEANGWRDAVRFIFVDLIQEDIRREDSNFRDMSKN